MTPLRPRTVALAAALVAIAAFAGSVLKVFDPDLFHHLAMGRHLARAGLAPGEPFLFPFLGARTGPPPYWLGSLAIYGWHALTGDAGLSFLPALVGGMLALVLFLDAAPREGSHTRLSVAAAALPLVLAMEGFRYRAAGRPELFATLFLAVTLWAIRRFEDGRRRALYAFPALALAWANVHPSVSAGIAAVGVLVVAAWARWGLSARRAGPADPAPRAAALAASAVEAAGLLAACATPSPDNPVALGFRFLSSASGLGGIAPGAAQSAGREILRGIPEMQPIRPHFWVEPFGILLVLTALTFVLRWRAVRWREVGTVALFAALAFGAARFAVLLAVVCAPIAARNLAAALRAVPEAVGRVPARALAAWAAVAAALTALPLATLEPALCAGIGFRPGAYPVRAADYLARADFRGRLFNTFHFGGYLSWLGVGPPYQDGRGLLHPGEERAALQGPLDRHAFEALDAKYRFDALLLAYPSESPEATARFQRAFGDEDWTADRTRWSLVAFDDAAMLYLRRDGAYAALAARDEYRFAKPANAVLAPAPDALPGLLSDYRRAVRESPGCLLCRYYHSLAALTLGLGSEARESLAQVPDSTCVARVLPFPDVRAAVAGTAGPP
jgi:hypothetical protein